MNRVVYYGQWVAALLIPLFYVVGRVWLGAGGGWLIVLGVVLGPLMALLLLIPPVLTAMDPATRAARATGRLYAIWSLVLWGLGFLMVITKSDQADGPKVASALSHWTGISISASDGLNTVFTIAFWAVWVVILVRAARTLVAGRRSGVSNAAV